ncbi:hypothetical protein [Bradyrhizobium sp.]|uniref:hypothetical protein n=1 Tax=Bradyrhizobium sp. TaxID=376 RepID=UPI00262E5BC9|nr:hypothetical protein [Bradyrhizobium sp.]
MQTGPKPKANDDRRDFVVIPSDQVRVAPSDAEITDLLRAAARQHSEAGVRAAPDPDTPVPTVDANFRATVSDVSPASGPTWGRRLMRALAALLVAGGITGAALGWQVFGYTAKKAFGKWLPQIALTSSLTMDKFGFGAESKPADKPADATADAAPASVAPALNAADNGTPEGSAAPAATVAAATAAPSPDPAQQLQSMANDLANANQEIETLKASIAELKASQQQMAHDLAKTSEKLAEQSAKAKVAATVPRPAAHRPSSSYSTTSTYSPSPTPAPPAAYRPTTSSYSVQAAAPPPPATAQSYVPPPIPLQPEPGSTSVPRPPMPVQ